MLPGMDAPFGEASPNHRSEVQKSYYRQMKEQSLAAALRAVVTLHRRPRFRPQVLIPTLDSSIGSDGVLSRTLRLVGWCFFLLLGADRRFFYFSVVFTAHRVRT